MARQPGNRLAQAASAGKLAVQQGRELALRRQPAHTGIGSMFIHKRVEPMPWNVLQKTVEYAIVVRHGFASLRVPKRRQTLGSQKNQCHAPCPSKLNRTAVAQARP